MSLVPLVSPDSEAELITLVALLDAHGIPVHVQGGGFGSLYPGPMVPGYNAKTILVPSEALLHARQLFEESFGPEKPFQARIDDLRSAEVQSLVEEHLRGMHGSSPPGTVHALALDGLRRPEVTFWSVWEGESLCGCGALKELDRVSGEIKSMRTRREFLRRGVGQFVLDELTRTAVERGYRQLYLETGTGPAFEAAHALYLKNGFAWCGPFGDYVATDFNVFMVKDL